VQEDAEAREMLELLAQVAEHNTKFLLDDLSALLTLMMMVGVCLSPRISGP
jgi:hypothetical protein